jgi:putative membrane protein
VKNPVKRAKSVQKTEGGVIMAGILIRWLILTAAILAAAHLIEGIVVSGFWAAFFAAAILGILNVFFKPLLIILTLPVNILTLGLFTVVINAVLLKMASALITGFDIHGFWPAVFGAIIISVVNWLLGTLISDRGHPGAHENPGNSGSTPHSRPGEIDLEKKGDRWE